MKIHPLIAGAFLSLIVALQAWTLKSVHELKINVAVLTQRVDDYTRQAFSQPTPPTQLAIHRLLWTNY